MSVYKLLSTPVPTIAYCAMHQALPGVPAVEYEKTMREFHDRVAEETGIITASYGKYVRESVSRQSQLIRVALSQFLQTPISTDDEHVQEVLDESLEKFRESQADGSGFGLKQSVEGKFFFPPSKKAREKRLLQNGRAYLEELGFNFGRTRGEIFESIFIVNGGMNLDILEHIVRDRLGIYSTTHGKHIKEFDSYSYAAYNLVHVNGALPGREKLARYTELDLYFSKPDIPYGPFREGLVAALNGLSQKLGVDYISLWQRKLGLGAGKEFVLRIVCGSATKVGQSLKWLEGYKEHSFVRQAVIEDGKLLVKELLF